MHANPERWRYGRGHLAEAARLARRALASGDDAQIADAALHCQGLELTGRDVSSRRQAVVVASRGGKTRGEKQTDEAQERWGSWIAQFHGLVASGTNPLIARAKMTKEITAAVTDGRSPMHDGSMPSSKTIRHWLK
jgi:hypothetical protein